MPKKNSGEIRSIKKFVRFSPTEYKKLQDKMQQVNIKKFGMYARLRLFQEGKYLLQDDKRNNSDKGEKGAITENQLKIILEVNRIGNNLNQITKAMNEAVMKGGLPNVKELSTAMNRFTEELVLIKNAMLYKRKS